MSIFVDLTRFPLESIKEIAPPVWTVHWVCPGITSLKSRACCTVLVRIVCIGVVSYMMNRRTRTLVKFIVIWRLTHGFTCCCGAVWVHSRGWPETNDWPIILVRSDAFSQLELLWACCQVLNGGHSTKTINCSQRLRVDGINAHFQ